MRDLETIESALRIAETGHLTFATLAHQFGDFDHQPYRGRISGAPAAAGAGPAFHGARRNPLPIAAAAPRWPRPRHGDGNPDSHGGHSQPDPRRQDSPDLFGHADRDGQTGMQTFNQSLANAYFQKFITLETALARSSNPDELQDLINRGVTSPAASGRPVRRYGGKTRGR